MAEAKYPSASSSEEDNNTRSQTFNQKLGDFKKFASTSFSRAKQVLNLGQHGNKNQGAWLHSCMEVLLVCWLLKFRNV